jgi:hypothetical protein
MGDLQSNSGEAGSSVLFLPDPATPRISARMIAERLVRPSPALIVGLLIPRADRNIGMPIKWT